MQTYSRMMMMQRKIQFYQLEKEVHVITDKMYNIMLTTPTTQKIVSRYTIGKGDAQRLGAVQV